MDLNEKLEALEKQAAEIRNMFFKVSGAIELTKALIDEENKPKSKEESEEKPEESKEE